MPVEYLPIMAEAGAPKPPRVLVSPLKQAWVPVAKPVSESKVALPGEDLSYRNETVPIAALKELPKFNGPNEIRHPLPMAGRRQPRLGGGASGGNAARPLTVQVKS